MWRKFPFTHQELRILFTMYRATTSHSPAIVENAKKIWRENVTRRSSPVPMPSRSQLRHWIQSTKQAAPRERYPLARPGAGVAPSCCSRLSRSQLCQASTTFSSTRRTIPIPDTVTGLPVGGMPNNSPL
jgi:hypothetical protein